MNRAAVLGSPIHHSLSPALHRAAYAALGLDWTYDAIDVDETSLAEFVDGMDDTWRGLSLTMPLKKAVLPLLDERSPLVDTTGVANTVLVRDGLRYGDNTDVYGIVAAVREAGVSPPSSTTILGGGATAASALAAVAELGATHVYLVARSEQRATDALTTADRLGVAADFHPWEFSAAEIWAVDLLISTVPAGAADAAAADAPPDVSGVGPGGASVGGPRAVLDVVYDPWPTPLAHAAGSAGSRVVSGLAMLIHQAARQVELMTGRAAPIAAMQAAGTAELQRRS